MVMLYEVMLWLHYDYVMVILEEQPHVQGGVAAWAQEGREELIHIQGQEGWL